MNSCIGLLSVETDLPYW